MTDSQKWLVLALTAGTLVLLYLLAPVLTPFLASALLAYLGDPMVDALERRGWSRTSGVVAVFIGMLCLGALGLFILLPALEQQVATLVGKLPVLLEWLNARVVPWVSSRFGVEVDIDPARLREQLAAHWGEVSNLARNLLFQLGKSGQAIFGWLSFILLVPVVTFYLLRDWDALVANLRELLPRHVEPRLTAIAGEIDAVLAEFLRGQLMLMAALAAIYVAGLWLVGLDLAFSIGIIAGLVSFVPYLGLIVGLVLAGASALAQFGDFWHFLGVAAVFGIGNVLEGMVLAPRLVGERIGLHPVAVIFAVMAGGQLFGFVGVLLALPAAAAVVVVLRHTRDEYKRSSLYERSAAPTGHE